METLNLLKEVEKKVNNICIERGFELTLLDKGEYYGNMLGEILVRNFNKSILPFTIQIRYSLFDLSNTGYIQIIKNGYWVDDVNIYETLPKLLYNYFNIDSIKFVCNLEGGKYDKETLSRDEIEKKTYKHFNKNMSFEEMINYIPFLTDYNRAKRPIVEFGTIYFTLLSTKNFI